MFTVTLYRRWLNFGVFGFFLVLSLLAYSVTGSFPSPLLPGYPGAAMFPRLTLIAMGTISAFGMLKVFLSGGGANAQGEITLPLGKFLAVVGLLVAFTLCLSQIGLEISVFALIAGSLWFRSRKVVVPVVAGLISVGVVYLIFVQALSVGLPLLFLPRYLMGY